ncbi:MAG: hypothetical protein HQM09_20785 [Candidatus Riflebacteria bacterium]|nr:hypothetical protein [Candidatus Riflebacteria bacterium]
MKMNFMRRTIIVSYFVTLLCMIALIAGADSTTMVSAVWVGNSSVGLVQAQINGKLEMICLPRMEFTEPVDKDELANKLKTGIKRQDAIFHLYQDGIGQPRRQGSMLFASDVFLKELKMTYSGALRSFGYQFKISKKPPFEDAEYARENESGAFVVVSAAKAAQTTNSSVNPASAAGTNVSAGNPGTLGAGGTAISTSGGSTVSVKTSYDVLPAGVLPPSMRKLKDQIDARVREIKNRPYQVEVPKVDVVRWATGKMGMVGVDGRIADAPVEGQKLSLKITPPKDTKLLTPERQKALEGQPCEYVFLRDKNGREAVSGGCHLLSDIYLTDLGQTWQEWVQSQGSTLATPTFGVDANLATGPVNLRLQAVEGTWKRFLTPVLGQISITKPVDGMGSTEIIRLPPLDLGNAKFEDISKAADAQLIGQVVSVSIMVSPDGKPYTELGQKRAARIWLPGKNMGLPLLIKTLTQK